MRRWLDYRVGKLHKLYSTRVDPRKNPYSALVAKLSGIHQPPKARQAYQQLMHEDYAAKVDPVVTEKWSAELKAKGPNLLALPNAAFRAKVARDVFKDLLPAEQVRYAQRARAHAQQAKDAYENEMKKLPSLEPESIQKYVQVCKTFNLCAIQFW